MATERITELPGVTNALMADIIMAVQGYVSPSVLGTSVQQTWQQVFNLFLANTVLNNAGNPNGNLAGTQYQLCWDTTNKTLYVCSTSGTATTAVWSSVTNGISYWTDVTGVSATMSGNAGYIADNAGLVTLTMPATILQGQVVEVAGKGAGGWLIAQNAGQTIHLGSSATTVGVAGSLASTNQYDTIKLLCVTANTTFVALSVIGNITVV